MTTEEAITNLEMIGVAFVEPITNEQRKLIDDTFDMAINALEQINKIKAIIESPIYIQEDVFRYKAICEVFKSEEQA